MRVRRHFEVLFLFRGLLKYLFFLNAIFSANIPAKRGIGQEDAAVVKVVPSAGVTVAMT